MTSQEESDEEYLDDPIRLIDLEQERISGFLHSVTDAKETINATISVDLTDSGDENVVETSNPLKVASKLPVTFFTIPRNVRLFNDCRDLCIKVVNCVEHPGYYKKHFKIKDTFLDDDETSSDECNWIEEYDLDTDEEVNVRDNRDLSNREISKVQKGDISNKTPTSEEENFIMPPNDQTVKPKIRPVDITAYLSNHGSDSRTLGTPGEKKSFLQTKSSREDTEKPNALCQKNESQINFKKNLGLIGLKISHVINSENTVSNTKKVRKEKRKKKLPAEEKRCEGKVNPEVTFRKNEKITNIKDRMLPHNLEYKKFPNSALSSKDFKQNTTCKMMYESEKHILNLNGTKQNIVDETPKLNTLPRPVPPKVNCTEHVSEHKNLHYEKDIQKKNKSPRGLLKEQKNIIKQSDNSKSVSNFKSSPSTYMYKESSPHSTKNSVKDHKKTNKFLNDQLKARAKSIKETSHHGQNIFKNNSVHDSTSNESAEQTKNKHNDNNDIVLKYSSSFVNKDAKIAKTVLNKQNSNNNHHNANNVQNDSKNNQRFINYSFVQSSETKKSESDPYNNINKELSEPKKNDKKVKTKYSKKKSLDGIAKIKKPPHRSADVQSCISNVELNSLTANRSMLKSNTDLQNALLQNNKGPTVGNVKLNSFYVEKTVSGTPTILQQEIDQDNNRTKYGIPPQTSISVQDKPNLVNKVVTRKDDNNPAKLSSYTTAIDAPPLTDVSQPTSQNYDNVGYTITTRYDGALKSSTANVKKQANTNSLLNESILQSKKFQQEAIKCINNQFYANSNNLNQEALEHNVPNEKTDSCHKNKIVIGSNLPQISNPLVNPNIPVSNYSGVTNTSLIIRNDLPTLPKINNPLVNPNIPVSKYSGVTNTSLIIRNNHPTLPNPENQLNSYQNKNYIQNQGLPIPTIGANILNDQTVKIGHIALVKQNLRAYRQTKCAVPDYSTALYKNYLNNYNPIYSNPAFDVPPHSIGRDYLEKNNSCRSYLWIPPIYPPPPPPTNHPQNINQTVFAPQNVRGSTIIGMNKTGVVRKINIAARPVKNSQDTTQQYNINHPDTTPANTKNEMLKELSKMPIFEDPIGNDLKRPFSETAKHPEISNNLCKKPKLDSTLPKSATLPDNINFRVPVHKGYSPPILPIPTYEKTFEILLKNKVFESQTALKQNVYNANVPCVNVNSNKRPLFSLEGDTKDKSAKKISLDEYKKRVIRSDGSLTDQGLCKADRIKIESTKVDSRHNSELDLGYDSDTTVKL